MSEIDPEKHWVDLKNIINDDTKYYILKEAIIQEITQKQGRFEHILRSELGSDLGALRKQLKEVEQKIEEHSVGGVHQSLEESLELAKSFEEAGKLIFTIGKVFGGKKSKKRAEAGNIPLIPEAFRIPKEPELLKICKTCGERKPKDQFQHKSGESEPRDECKECGAEYNTKYHLMKRLEKDLALTRTELRSVERRPASPTWAKRIEFLEEEIKALERQIEETDPRRATKARLEVEQSIIELLKLEGPLSERELGRKLGWSLSRMSGAITSLDSKGIIILAESVGEGPPILTLSEHYSKSRSEELRK